MKSSTPEELQELMEINSWRTSGVDGDVYGFYLKQTETRDMHDMHVTAIGGHVNYIIRYIYIKNEKNIKFQ